MRQVFIVDSVKSFQRIPKNTGADVLAINIDSAGIFDEINSRNSQGWDIALLDIEKFVEDANIQIRDFYRNTLNEYIQRQHLSSSIGNSNLLLLDFTETSPFKGKLTNSLYFLALFRCVLAESHYEKVNVLVGDKALSDIMNGTKSRWTKSSAASISYWLQACRFLISVILTKVLVHAMRIKSKHQDLDYRVFTLFPYWWLRSQTEKAQDRFFPGLDEIFSTQSIGYLTWLEINPHQFVKNRRNLVNTIQSQRMELLNSYVRIRDLFSLFSFREYFTLRNLITSGNSKSPIFFLDFDIRKLLNDEISRSIGSGDFARSRVIFKSTSRFLSGRRMEGIIFRFENQPIDRAIVQASLGKTRSIGYWHSALAMCENYLSLWNLQEIGELSMAAGGHSLTMPDKMLYANEYCKLSLIREGFLESEIYYCGPTRHFEVLRAVKGMNLRENQDSSRDVGNYKNNSVLISFSADPIASKLMLATVLKVTSVLQDFRVNIKTHPAWQFTSADLEAFCSKSVFVKPKLMGPKDNLYLELAKSEVLISSGTQLAFEAILLGVAPIVFESNSIFIPTNFSSFKDSCFLATNLEELEAAINEVMLKGNEYLLKRNTWDSLSTKLFGDLKEVSEYAPLIDALARITDSSF